ncbi:MAG: nitrate/nitrite transporter NrtS [Rhizobiaceae bacterium]
MKPETQTTHPSIVQMMFEGGTPKKAFFTALVVGTILTTINHGDLIVDGTFPPIWKIALTYCVPYCVTTWGAVTGKMAEWRRLNTNQSFDAEGIRS